MKLNLLFIVLFCSSISFAQDNLDPFYIYGPREDVIFVDYNKALKQNNSVSKLKLIDVDLSSNGEKLAKFDSLCILELQNNHLSSFPVKFFSNANLQYLSSSGNPITGFSNEIFGLSSLIILKLHKTAIDSFPPSFKYLSNLKEFDFQLNEDTCKLGSAFSGLKMIKKILINKVPLSEFPIGLDKNKNLIELYLPFCNLSKMDSSLFLCQKLEVLVLDNNQFSTFPRQFSNLKSLRKLSLKNNQIKNCPEFLSELKQLEILDLTGNPIDVHQLEVLKILLPTCRITH